MPDLKEMTDEKLLAHYTTWFDEDEVTIFEQGKRIKALKQEILARMARGKGRNER